MAKFQIERTPLDGLQVISRLPISDDRGYLERLYCKEELAEAFGQKSIAQVNHSYTSQPGVVRGMHFQYPPHTEIKMVTCIRGSVFDVAIDLRRNSRTYLKWFGLKLKADKFMSLAIPEGFAHGFQTLESNCELIYFHSEPYVSTAEGAVNATDEIFQISWPLPISERSTRDKNHPMISKTFQGLS